MYLICPENRNMSGYKHFDHLFFFIHVIQWECHVVQTYHGKVVFHGCQCFWSLLSSIFALSFRRYVFLALVVRMFHCGTCLNSGTLNSSSGICRICIRRGVSCFPLLATYTGNAGQTRARDKQICKGDDITLSFILKLKSNGLIRVKWAPVEVIYS